MKKTKNEPNIPSPSTNQQFKALDNAYQYFNGELFDGQLPNCILNFSRKKGTHGFLAPYRWKEVGQEEFSIHEISLTPSTLYRTPIEIFSTLVHEMVHLWQFEFGSPSRSGYHNKEWARKMEAVGLIPSNTGKEGGKKTGQSMTHYIEREGLYEVAFNKMPQEYILPFTSWDGEVIKLLSALGNGEGSTPTPPNKKRLVPKSKNKVKYSCSCLNNVWGKPNLNIRCEDCGELFIAVN